MDVAIDALSKVKALQTRAASARADTNIAAAIKEIKAPTEGKP
jgi:hypothetical protein